MGRMSLTIESSSSFWKRPATSPVMRIWLMYSRKPSSLTSLSVKMKATGCPFTPATLYRPLISSNRLVVLYVLVIVIWKGMAPAKAGPISSSRNTAVMHHNNTVFSRGRADSYSYNACEQYYMGRICKLVKTVKSMHALTAAGAITCQAQHLGTVMVAQAYLQCMQQVLRGTAFQIHQHQPATQSPCPWPTAC